MSKDKQVKTLARQLKNVGPKLAEKLIDAGIESPETLRQMGARKAFDRIYAKGDAYGDYNAAYLYALEGAVQDCDWLEIPEAVKEEYKAYARRLQSEKDRSE